ncbi:MAG: hypothetical protein RL095_247 [Verrucomicrobiota bacterium]|jgi:hypothetical protein
MEIKIKSPYPIIFSLIIGGLILFLIGMKTLSPVLMSLSVIPYPLILILVMTTKHNQADNKWSITLGTSAAFMTIMILMLMYPMLMDIHIGKIDKQGQFGDQFGFLNTLFSGCALCALIHTLRLQSAEIKNQEDESKKQAASNKFMMFTKLFEDVYKSHDAQMSATRPGSPLSGGITQKTIMRLYDILEAIAEDPDLKHPHFDRITKLFISDYWNGLREMATQKNNSRILQILGDKRS